MRNVKPDTIIRTVLLIIALINQTLAVFNKSPLPISDDQITLLLSTAITVSTAIWSWWKNNSFTQAALAADEAMHNLKNYDYGAEISE